MQHYIGSCHKVSERRAPYLEQSTAHFEDVVNITVDSDTLIPQNRSIEENSSKTIEQNASNQIDQIASKQKEIARKKIAYIPHFKACLNNLTNLLTTQFGEILPRNLMT